MMHMGDDFARLESFEHEASLTPDQEAILDQMGEELDAERIQMLEHDAEVEMLETMMNSGILQPQDI